MKKLFGIIVLVLLTGFLVSFLISKASSDPTWESFFINVSAGFFGSAFTFGILTYFEQRRSYNEKAEQLTLRLKQITEFSDRISIELDKAHELYEMTGRITRVIDMKNPERAIEILEPLIKMVDHQITLLEADVSLFEILETMSAGVLNEALDLGVIEFITRSQKLLESHKQLGRGIQGVATGLQNIRNRMGKILEELKDFDKEIKDSQSE